MRYLLISTLFIVILLSGCASQKALFEQSVALNTIEAYQNFLIKYPAGEMADQVKQKLILLEYDRALKMNTVEGYERFLRVYQDSTFALKINEQLTTLQNEIAFREAMTSQNFKKGEELLALGVSVDCADKNGFAALHHASQAGEIKTVTFLLNHEANINAEGLLGETAYLLADNDVMASYLLQKGAEKIDKSKYGVTPVMLAARHGRINRLKTLLKNGADVNAKDMQGVSALHWAISPQAGTDAVGVLLDNSALINIKDADGKTPLSYALDNNNLEIFKFLVNKGARFDLHSDTGFYYFKKSVYNKNHEMVNFILSTGEVTLPEKVDNDFYINTWDYLTTITKDKTAAEQLELISPWLLNVSYRLNSFEEKIFLTDVFSWAAILHGRNNQNARAAIANLTAAAIIHTTYEDFRSYIFDDVFTGLSSDTFSLFESLRRLEEKQREVELGSANIRKTRKFLHSLGVASLYLGTFDFMKALAQTQSEDKEKSEEAMKAATEKVAELIGTDDAYKQRCNTILNNLFTIDKDCWPALEAFILFPDKKPLENIVLMPRFYDYEYNIEEYLDKFKEESIELAQKWVNDDFSTNMQKSRGYYILGYHKVKQQQQQSAKVETPVAPKKIEVPTPAGNRTLSLDISDRREANLDTEKKTETPKKSTTETTTTQAQFNKDNNIFYDYYCLRNKLDNGKQRMDHLIEAAAEESKVALVLYNNVRGNARVPDSLVDWLLREIRKEKYKDNEANHVFIPLIGGLTEKQKEAVVNEMYNAFNFEWKDVASVYFKDMIPEDISTDDVLVVLKSSVPWKKVTLMNTIMARDSVKYLDLVQQYLAGQFYTPGDQEIIRRNLRNMFTKDITPGYNQQINYSAVNRAVDQVEPRFKAMLILAVADGLNLLEPKKSLNIIQTRFLTDDYLCVTGAQWILDNYKPEEHGKINFSAIRTTSKIQQAVIKLLETHYAPAPDYNDFVKRVDKLKDDDQWSELVNLGVKYGEADLFKQANEGANLSNPIKDKTLDVLTNNIKNRYMTILSEAK